MEVGAGYMKRRWSKYDPKAEDCSAASGPTHEVEFKKRPFGIPRYSPGIGDVGAIVREIIPKSRYPGDPTGQAFVGGVQPGWVVRSVNGKDVTKMDFEELMDYQDDEIFMGMHQALTGTEAKQEENKAEKAELPITVVFQEM